MRMLAINSSTGKVLMVNSGTMDEGSFRQTVTKSFPSIKPESIVVVCDGQIRPGMAAPATRAPQAPSPGKGVVWKGSFCLTPDSKVLTTNGVKEIKDIAPGDMVFTHAGRPKAVLRVWERQWHGEIVSIKTALNNEPMRLTPCHNVIGVRGSPCVLRENQACKPTCQLQHSKIKYMTKKGERGCFACVRRPYRDYFTCEIKAGQLSRNDFMLMPKLAGGDVEQINVVDFLESGAWSTDGQWVWPSRAHNATNKATIARSVGVKEGWLHGMRLSDENAQIVATAVESAANGPPMFDPMFDPVSLVHRIPAKYKLNPTLGRLLGLYCAEGSSYNTMSLALHKDETHLHDFAIAAVESEFGLSSNVQLDKRNKGASVVASSVMLARVLDKWCGKGAHNKKVPSFIFSASDDVVTGFINGLWDGDGNKRARKKDNSMKYGTVSASLAYGLRLLLSRFGVTASINVESRPGRAAYIVLISGQQLYENEWLRRFKYNQRPRAMKKTRTRNYYTTDEGSFVKITSIDRSMYSGPVFDLEVEEDHTYTVNGKAVHNSDLGGYANMNREIVMRLPQYGFSVRIDVLQTGMQVDPMTASLLNVFKNNRLQNEAQAPLVVGFTPMDVQGRGRKVAFFTMMETQRLHPEFVNRCNASANEVWVPCDFYERVFRESGIVRPVISLPLGVNHNLYVPGAPKTSMWFDDILGGSRVQDPSGFRFSSVFGWSYRKGPDILCKSFIREFDASDGVCLAIHSRYMGSSHEEHKSFVRREILGYYEEVGKENPPPIYYNGDCVPIPDMPGVYSSSDCFVFCSRGEGFGLPVVEAGACGIPVISAYHTAMTEYLDEDVSYLVSPSGYGPANERLTWISGYYRDQAFAIMGDDETEKFGALMRSVFEDRDASAAKARRFRERILAKYTWDACAARVAGRLATMS
jgi:glycosyltransferase involved in cell wall biosynthesis